MLPCMKNWLLFTLLLTGMIQMHAAEFTGGSQIEIADTSGGLSWVPANNAHTVSCWFKLSIPSNATLTESMLIAVDRRSGSESDPHAFLIQWNIATARVEFSARGSNGALAPQPLVDHPLLERWYHVAVVRSGSQFTGYLDGRQAFLINQDIGNAGNSDGVSLGGWNGNRRFRGEILEFGVWQEAADPSLLSQLMYLDINTLSFPGIVGYYKLGATNSLANTAQSPPAGTTPATTVGTVTFPNANVGGEQSTFDAYKNGGRDAVASLGGGFTWQQLAFARPTVGIPFEFRVGYSSSHVNNQSSFGQFDPFATSPMGKGWRHTFQMQLVPSTFFDPNGGSSVGLLSWDGNLEVWDFDYDNEVYLTRSGEYRGELRLLSPSSMEWTTPDRTIYRFRPADYSKPGEQLMKGKLLEIRDLNGNKITLNWNVSNGRLTSITDSAGGVHTLAYNAQGLITSLSFPGPSGTWSVNFTYDAQNRLLTKSLTGPAIYTATPPLNTTWQLGYHATSGLLDTITDPRGNPDLRVTYDAQGRLSTQRDALNRTSTIEYGVPAVRQVTHTDPAGKKWIETHDRKGRVIERSDPFGAKEQMEYDAAGNLTKSTDALGNITTTTYDARSNPLTQTNALGHTATWVNHPVFNKPITETNALNWSTHFEYDTAGNLTRQYDNLGDIVRYTYDAKGQTLTSRDANGNVSSFTYSPEGFILTKTLPHTGPATVSWSYTHNELGWLLSETNPLSQTVTTTHNINGQPLSITDPLSRTFTKTYDPNGNLLTESDAKATVTSYAYDAADQRTSMTDRAGKVWTYTYSPLGKLATATTPLSHTSTKTYDDTGRLIRETNPLSQSVSYEYDANDRLTATTDALGKRWEKTYDALNRVIAERDPLGNQSTTTFDAAGRVLTTTSPSGFPTHHEYDGRGRLTMWRDPEGQEWRYAYDANGNILDITDALGGHYLMTYGRRNERLTERNQDNFTWTYIYDELLRLKTQTDPNAISRTLTYDNGGRMTQVAFSTGRVNALTYDVNNNPTLLTRTSSGQPATTTGLAYDAMDRVTTVTDTFGFQVGYEYDDSSRQKKLIYPGNKPLTYTLDALGRITGMTDWDSRVSAFTYDAAGRLATRTYPNGVTQTNGFDESGRQTTLNYKRQAEAQPFIALSYAYDRNGNKTSSEEKGLLPWTPPPRQDVAAAYTPSGRLISRTDTGDSPATYTYSYDSAGNMTLSTDGGKNYALSYDEDNRTTSIQLTQTPLATQTILNRYDALGRRVSRTLNGTETRYILNLASDLERILCDATSTGTLTAFYIHAPGGLLYKVDASNNVTAYHADAMANVVSLTSGTGTEIAQHAYSPYGVTLAENGAANAYKFVGSQGVMEELPGLCFMRARYYLTAESLFLSCDPVKPIGSSWQPLAYRYANNNPNSFVDPNGEIAGWALGFAAAGAVEMAAQFGQWLGGGQYDHAKVASSAMGGAVAGALIVDTGGIGLIVGAGVLAGSASGFAEEATYQGLSGDGFDLNKLSDKIIWDGVTGGIIAPLEHYLDKLPFKKRFDKLLKKTVGEFGSKIYEKGVDRLWDDFWGSGREARSGGYSIQAAQAEAQTALLKVTAPALSGRESPVASSVLEQQPDRLPEKRPRDGTYYRERIKALEKTLERLRDKLRDLSTSSKSMDAAKRKKKMDSLKSEISSTRSSIGKLRDKIKD
jgi:RHS repeat-associated protein